MFTTENLRHNEISCYRSTEVTPTEDPDKEASNDLFELHDDIAVIVRDLSSLFGIKTVYSLSWAQVRAIKDVADRL